MILFISDWMRRRRDRKIRIVLNLLSHHGEMRVIDIVKASNGTFRRRTVYIFLDSLVVDGHISCRSVPFEFAGVFGTFAEEPSAPAFHINCYSITEIGRAFL